MLSKGTFLCLLILSYYPYFGGGWNGGDFLSLDLGEESGWYIISTDFGARESGEVLKERRIRLGGGFTFVTPSSRCDDPFGWGPFCGDVIVPLYVHFSFDGKISRTWDGIFRLSVFPSNTPNNYLISSGAGVKGEVFRALRGNLIVSIGPLLEYSRGRRRYFEGETVPMGEYISYANGIGFALPLWVTRAIGKGSFYIFAKAKTGYTYSQILETGWTHVGMGGGFEYGRNHRLGIELYYFHQRFWGIKKIEVDTENFWNFFGVSVFFNFRLLRAGGDLGGGG